VTETLEQTSNYTFVLGGDVRVLVMDDDPIQCEFARVYLSTPTASVETAENGEEGLKLLRAEKFDLAVVDLDMPVMNGFQTIRAIRNDPQLRNMPIVIVTGREDVESIDRAYDEGATSFVTKPVNWRLLSYQLRYVLRAQRMASAS
jgi:CheY-like chemotaxis protein